MKTKINKWDYGVFLLLIGTFVLILIGMWALFGGHMRPHDGVSVDRVKLSELASAIQAYHLDYGELLSPAEFKTKLLECGMVENDEVFYSYATPSRIEIRYFVSGDRFVLVAPGVNGRYDTPEGHEELEKVEDTGDDLLRFVSVGIQGGERGQPPN